MIVIVMTMFLIPGSVLSPPSLYPSPASLHPSLQSASLSPGTPLSLSQSLQVPLNGSGPPGE